MNALQVSLKEDARTQIDELRVELTDKHRQEIEELTSEHKQEVDVSNDQLHCSSADFTLNIRELFM